jgi:quinol-cytochrome oxidoreductase complex cytochrome b subunit
MVNKTAFLINDFLYKLSLVTLGMTGLVLIIYVKSKSHSAYRIDTPIYFYTIAITTFQLSRLLSAIFYRHSKKAIP